MFGLLKIKVKLLGLLLTYKSIVLTRKVLDLYATVPPIRRARTARLSGLLEIKIKLLGSLGARAGAQDFKSRTNVGPPTLNPIGLGQNLCKSHRDRARSEIRTSFIVSGSDQLNIRPDLISVVSVCKQNPTRPA